MDGEPDPEIMKGRNEQPHCGKSEVAVSELAKHGKYTFGPSFPTGTKPSGIRMMGIETSMARCLFCPELDGKLVVSVK